MFKLVAALALVISTADLVSAAPPRPANRNHPASYGATRYRRHATRHVQRRNTARYQGRTVSTGRIFSRSVASR